MRILASPGSYIDNTTGTYSSQASTQANVVLQCSDDNSRAVFYSNLTTTQLSISANSFTMKGFSFVGYTRLPNPSEQIDPLIYVRAAKISVSSESFWCHFECCLLNGVNLIFSRMLIRGFLVMLGFCKKLSVSSNVFRHSVYEAEICPWPSHL